MSTNYHIKGFPEDQEDSPEWHIGKRSAAGAFCFDCGVTLCKDGPDGVHTGKSQWHSKCPKCSKELTTEGLGASAAGLELGFNKNPTAKKTGVASASSFTFAMDLPSLYKNLAETFGESGFKDSKIIVNEYGDEFTLDGFKEILFTCPQSLRFYNLLGQEFG